MASVNDLTFQQAATLLTSIYEQASGQQSTIQPIDTATFTTVGQLTLKTGYDTVIEAISQVLAKTIFSIRPYNAKFNGIFVDEQRFGNITRKINFVDGDIEDDEREPLTDGQSVDQWKINKPKILQTNFYGFNKYQRHVTIFKDQLDVAFTGPEEFSRFITGVIQNVMDQLEQVKESEARATLANFIVGKVNIDNSVINVLQEYYNETGVELSPATMYQDTYYIPFVKWFYAYVNRLTLMLAERTEKYHINVSGKEVMRHTPANMLKAYMSARMMTSIDSVALPTIFGADRLKMIDWEAVNFWQNIDDPESVYAKATVLQTDGTLRTMEAAALVNNVLGFLFDRDALGITRKSEWVQQTPMNAAGGYSNIFYHFSYSSWNDFTENAIVLVADTVTTT
jgi:hypothetical protein